MRYLCLWMLLLVLVLAESMLVVGCAKAGGGGAPAAGNPTFCEISIQRTASGMKTSGSVGDPLCREVYDLFTARGKDEIQLISRGEKGSALRVGMQDIPLAMSCPNGDGDCNFGPDRDQAFVMPSGSRVTIMFQGSYVAGSLTLKAFILNPQRNASRCYFSVTHQLRSCAIQRFGIATEATCREITEAFGDHRVEVDRTAGQLLIAGQRLPVDLQCSPKDYCTFTTNTPFTTASGRVVKLGLNGRSHPVGDDYAVELEDFSWQ